MKSSLKVGSYDVSCETKGEIALVSAFREGRVLLESTVSSTSIAVPIVFRDGDRQVEILLSHNGKSAVIRDGATVAVGKASLEFFTIAHRAFGLNWEKEGLYPLVQVFYTLMQTLFLSYLVAARILPEFSWTNFALACLIGGVFFTVVSVIKYRGAVRSLRASLNNEAKGT